MNFAFIEVQSSHSVLCAVGLKVMTTLLGSPLVEVRLYQVAPYHCLFLLFSVCTSSTWGLESLRNYLEKHDKTRSVILYVLCALVHDEETLLSETSFFRKRNYLETALRIGVCSSTAKQSQTVTHLGLSSFPFWSHLHHWPSPAHSPVPYAHLRPSGYSSKEYKKNLF